MREDLPDARLCAVPPSVPVIVNERADAGLDAGAARELDDVLDVPQRAEDEDIPGPIQLGVFRNLGAPSRDPEPDGRSTPVLKPLCRILAVRLHEGVGDGMEEVRVRAHTALPYEGVLAVALMDSARSPLEAPSDRRRRLRMATTRLWDERRGPKASRSRGYARERNGKLRKAGRTRNPVDGRSAGSVATSRRRTGKDPAEGRILIAAVTLPVLSANGPYCAHGEGSRTGAEDHALVSESNWCRIAYGARRSGNLDEVTRRAENRNENNEFHSVHRERHVALVVSVRSGGDGRSVRHRLSTRLQSRRNALSQMSFLGLSNFLSVSYRPRP